jgi:hypothetical protein
MLRYRQSNSPYCCSVGNTVKILLPYNTHVFDVCKKDDSQWTRVRLWRPPTTEMKVLHVRRGRCNNPIHSRGSVTRGQRGDREYLCIKRAQDCLNVTIRYPSPNRLSAMQVEANKEVGVCANVGVTVHIALIWVKASTVMLLV